MKRPLALALVLLLAASPASSLTRYVSPSGTAGLTYGFSTSTPTTLAFFNSNSDKGDTCLMLAGVYSTKIEPRATGTPDSFIVYIGDVTTPANVQVTAINIDSTLGATRCISVKGVLATGDLSLKTDSSVTAGYDSVSYCTIRGQATIQGRDNVTLYNNTIGTGDVTDKFHVTNGMPTGITYNNNGTPGYTADDWPEHNWQRYRSRFVDSLSIVGNTFYLGTTGRDINAATWRGVQRSVVDGNRFYLSSQGGTDTHLNTWYDCSYNTVTDNLFEGTSSAATTIPYTYLMNLRDNNVGNTWARDTLVQATTSAKGLKVAFNTAGNNRDFGEGNPLPFVTRTYDFGDSNNTFTQLVIRVGGDVEIQSKCDNTVISFSSIAFGGIMWLGAYGANSFPDSGGTDSLIFRHNTVYSESDNGRIIYPENSKVKRSTFTSNILVAKYPHSLTATRGHYGFYGPGAAGGPSFLACDTNLVYCTTAPQDSLWAVNLDFLSSNSACKVGTNSTWGQPPYSYDRISKWGNPELANTALLEFDPTPDQEGLAYSSDWKDGYVGAIAPNVDPDDPVVTITGPTGSRLWTSGEIMNVEWTSTDAVGVTSHTVQWGLGASPSEWITVESGLDAADVVYNWRLPTFTTTYATVKVLAYDAAGNSGYATLTFRCNVDPDLEPGYEETP